MTGKLMAKLTAVLVMAVCALTMTAAQQKSPGAGPILVLETVKVWPEPWAT